MPTSKGEPERRRRGPPAPGTPWEKPEPIPLGRTWGGKAAGEAEKCIPLGLRNRDRRKWRR